MSLPEETDILASNFQKFLATVLSKAQEDEGHSTQQPHFDLRNIDALLAQYSSQRTASEQALQKRTAIIQKLKGQAQKVLSRYRQLQTKYKELQEEQNATPKTVTDTVEPDGAACDSASQPTPQLITELQSETSCLKHEVAALQASQARQNEDSERQSQQCNALQAKVAASTADKEKLQANLKRVQESLHAALEEAACAKKQAAAESVTAQDEVNSSTANEMDDLQHQLQEARAQLLEESDACTDLRARVSAGAVKLKQQSTELRRMHIKLGKVQEKLSSETASFKEERAKANAALVAAKTEAEKYMNVASSTGEKIASLEKTRAELLDETNTLRDQLHAAATTAVGFQREAAQTGSLQREISALKSTLETVEQQLEMENTIQLQTNSALTAAHVDMESQAEHFSEERERLQHELQKLKDSHAAQWALMSSRQEQDQVAEETGGSGSKDEFATLTAKNAELVRQLDDVRAQAQLDQLEMASLLREEQDRCEKEVSSYENRCRAEQQTELEEVKAQLEQCLDKNEVCMSPVAFFEMIAVQCSGMLTVFDGALPSATTTRN